MRRRLTVAMLATVAAALLFAGLGTLLLARLGARNAAELDLRTQAESTAFVVEFGNSQAGTLSVPDLEAIRSIVCAIDTGQGESYVQLRALFCDGDSPEAIAELQKRICANTAPRLVASLPAETRAARSAFCAKADLTTLNAYRETLCTIPTDGLTNNARNTLERYRRLPCGQTRRLADRRERLQSTLSQESIDLVQVDENDQVNGSLSNGLPVGLLDIPRLRNGDTVSGDHAGRLFAAAAVGAGNESFSVIVVQRDADPLAGSARWFLLAAGATILLATLVALWLSRRLTDPLRRATEVTTRIAHGDLTSRLDEGPHGGGRGQRGDEIDELARSINAMADSLERSKGLERQFLLSVSHDLRTPLTSIRGYAEALADGATPDPQRAAGIILAESRRLERLVGDLLDLARLDARRFALRVRQIDLTELAADSVDGFRHEVGELGLEIALDADGPAVAAFADPDRLQQVVANLVENALKYARSRIDVAVRPGTPGGDGPTLQVSDDGPGISPADQPHVFERLYVASALPARKETGSGLGLAIVRELVEAMGGSVGVSNRADGAPGTCMTVVLRDSPPDLPAPIPDRP